MKELYEGLLDKLTVRVDKLEKELLKQQKNHKEQVTSIHTMWLIIMNV